MCGSGGVFHTGLGRLTTAAPDQASPEANRGSQGSEVLMRKARLQTRLAGELNH